MRGVYRSPLPREVFSQHVLHERPLVLLLKAEAISRIVTVLAEAQVREELTEEEAEVGRTYAVLHKVFGGPHEFDRNVLRWHLDTVVSAFLHFPVSLSLSLFFFFFAYLARGRIVCI
jgi:hypothetical protein